MLYFFERYVIIFNIIEKRLKDNKKLSVMQFEKMMDN
jgi:hypothetical protein